jgi:hypothetical protein
MGFSKFFLNAGEALRPVLTKIIPMKLLSKMKAGIINNATDKLSADSIAEYEPGVLASTAIFIFLILCLSCFHTPCGIPDNLCKTGYCLHE